MAEWPNKTWLVERGIGEDRFLLLEGEQVLAARIEVHGEPKPGDVYTCRLVSRTAGSARGTVHADAGFDILVDKLPRDVSEGSTLDIRLTRAPIVERGRTKMAQGRLADASDAVEERAEAREVAQFPAGLWEDVWDAASSGRLAFPGGEILCCPTPAMTVIDVDGDLAPKPLALGAIEAIAQALRWFAIGGSVGIDFPTLQAKADRAEVNTALDEALLDWPHERTAMNGFGFVQLVARLRGPSLLDRFATARTAMCARFALRMAERARGDGGMLALRIHPALRAHLTEDWIAQLARRIGKPVRIETDPALALEAPSAQIVHHDSQS
ncbi:ribonuclease [Aurantiacibacter gangjinensis]|uniref:Ribonuclease n=1 Tax=Aurantiacibacter gangjinensis TaxID=502682 RepID=A0A0G9MRF6_9SPHN|nr:ribonuclease [Aurantiacibacter gangjinensis]APE29240.1 Ribonuclease [Aurantiacibacter gangjinensis]KLE33295.1 ribonuclease [Aurantiacibacter gangjinensis]